MSTRKGLLNKKVKLSKKQWVSAKYKDLEHEFYLVFKLGMDSRSVQMAHHMENPEAEVYEGVDDQALGDGAHVFPQGLTDRGLRSIAVKVHV